jgi:hypothetical protein
MPAKSKYTKKKFSKDLSDLTKLINSYKGGSVQSHDPMADTVGSVSGGKPKRSVKRSAKKVVKRSAKKVVKRSVKRSTKKEERRSFTIVQVDAKKLPSGEGRYTIKANSSQTPSNAARKACTRALSKRKTNKLTIHVRETTSGSDKVVKCYNCSRTKLKTPIKIERKGQPTQVITHKTNISERSK